MVSPSFHEDFSRDDAPKVGSERSFGLVFAAVFAIVGLWPLVDGGAARIWALAVGGLFLVAAFAAPALLKPLNWLWFKIGTLLNRVVSPLVMGLLFYLTVTPVALIMRLSGKDPLKLRFDRAAKSYWIERQPPGPAPESMRHQF